MPGDTTYTRQRKAGAILEPLLARNPDHPGLAHYLIHAYDSPVLALESGLRRPGATRDRAVGPARAAHAVAHLHPGGKLGGAVASNRRAAAAGQAFEQRLGMQGLWDQRGHAWDYLIVRLSAARDGAGGEGAAWKGGRGDGRRAARTPSPTTTPSPRSPRATRSSAADGRRPRRFPSGRRPPGAPPRGSPASPARWALRAAATWRWRAPRWTAWRRSRSC